MDAGRGPLRPAGRMRPNEFARRASPESGQRHAADAGIECIGCAVCYAGCDMVAWNTGYLGPAALNRAWTLVNDARDGAQDQRLAAVGGDGGCDACHSQQRCGDACPKGLNPTGSIAGLKRATAVAALPKGRISMPDGHTARVETLLWTAQRASAAVLAICVAVHLATIIYAVRGGLTAAKML